MMVPPHSDSRARISARRRRNDRFVTAAINAAGVGIIVLLLLMFVYLLRTTLPLAEGVGLSDPQVRVFQPQVSWVVAERDGRPWRLPTSPMTDAADCPRDCLVSAGLALRPAANGFELYRLTTGEVSAGTGTGTVAFPQARSYRSFAAPLAGGSYALHSDGQRELVVRAGTSGNLEVWLGDGGGELRYRSVELPGDLAGFAAAQRLILLADAREGRVLVIGGNRFADWQLSAAATPGTGLLRSATLPGVSIAINAVAWGPARNTLLIADGAGLLHRLDAGSAGLPSLGEPLDPGISAARIASEHGRRVSYLLSAEGRMLVLAPASGQILFDGSLPDMTTLRDFTVTAEGDALLAGDDDSLMRWELRNGAPETGWRSLWTRQWFSGYPAAAHVWHPDGEAIGVLPKFSLSPLLYGTFKAALYGMLLAIPMALGAAIYTGYFLSTRSRNRIKPAIELLEAFPTVVLGFIAGLWLAPLLVDYLTLVFILPLAFIALPLLLSLSHLGLQYLSPRFALRPPRAWLLVFVYLGALALVVAFLDDIETILFDGSMRDWLWREFRVHYAQRNTLLVGLAMGLAVTPTLFSIIEDAIHAVPSRLSDAGLALGATRWQTLAQVVMPSAAPAIVSAMLIGVSRGLGETMIVLLATGNTPIMDPGLFSGLRSLSASIAAELPEAGPDTLHFRLLFLAALVLFALTFVFNTLAELFRQRLRYSYAGHV